MMRRWLTAVLLAAGLCLLGAPAATAIDIPNPIGDAILDKICPPRQAPYPASPGDPVIKRGGGPGLYATYGYAGLRWTTWDAGCLSWDKADTSIGSQLNVASNALDETINEVQMAALDDSTTASFDAVIERAVLGLRDAFWNVWSAVGLGLVGLLVVLYMVSGRETDALGSAVSAFVVILAVFLLFSRPHLPAEVGNGMTSGVAQKVADSLIAVTPGGTMPASATPQEKFGEGYYQVSYRAWLNGWSCGDADAEARYGHRLLDAQAFSVPQYLAIRDNPDAATALVKSKQEAWTKIGEQMEKTNPVAFGCWKGEGQSRTAAAVKHAVVTICAGFWIVLGSVALLALKWVLRLAVLFAVAFGALMLFWRRLQDRMMEFVLLGLVGPPFVAAGVGVLLWGYYAILLNPDTSWWQAGVSAFALGLAVWFGKGMLQRMFVGVHEMGRSGRLVRGGAHRVRTTAAQYGVGTWGGTARTGATAGATAAAGAAGAAAAMAVLNARDGGDDARRHDDDDISVSGLKSPEDSGDSRRSPEVTQNSTPSSEDAPAQALRRAHAIAAARGDRPAGWRQEREGNWTPQEDWGDQDGRRDDVPTVEQVRDVVAPPATGDPEYGRADT